MSHPPAKRSRIEVAFDGGSGCGESCAIDGSCCGRGESTGTGPHVTDEDIVDPTTLILNPDGKIAGTEGLDYATKVFRNVFDPAREVSTDEDVHIRPGPLIDVLSRDARVMYCGESFWLEAGATPRCTLERIAKQVYEAHTEGVAGINPAISGAEWWCQLRERGDEKAKETIGFHWDKDEDLLDEGGLNVFPHLSTVTYLTEYGAPTLIADHRAPTNCAESIDGTFSSVVVSSPEQGKHIVFDGQLLHGVPAELAGWGRRQGASGDGGSATAAAAATGRRRGCRRPQRLTFLVNVWLNHVPSTLELSAEALGWLSDVPITINLSAASVMPLQSVSVRGGGRAGGQAARDAAATGPETNTLVSYFGPSGTEHVVTIPLPEESRVPSEATTFKVLYQRGASGCVESTTNGMEAREDQGDQEVGSDGSANDDVGD